MSGKPIKKTDWNKEWMKRRQDRVIKIQPEYHLIVTEGTKTEPQYFEAIKDAINKQYKNKIQLDIHGEGDNTLSLLEKAKKHAENSANKYKHVWVVYDTDDFERGAINRTAELCASYSNSETTYHATWSNQCIELWYLLHFSFFHSDIHRSGYFPKLTANLEDMDKGKYEKNRNDMFSILRPYMDEAIRNAKRLDALNEKKAPSSSAPGTKVYELLEVLKPYLV